MNPDGRRRSTIVTLVALTAAALVVPTTATASPVPAAPVSSLPDPVSVLVEGAGSRLVTGLGEPVQVNDPLRALQWHLERTRVPEAWALSLGTSQVTIALIDTGVDPEHRDLAGALWADPVTGAPGWDYVRGGTDPFVGADEDWHGTAVAGIAVARANDGYGIAGVAPGVRLMVRRIYASTSTSSPPALIGYADAARAVRDAASDGADVILITWGGTVPDAALFDAIRTAGVPVVAAAGNDGQDLSGDAPARRRYPAAYRLPNLVTVAASDLDGGLLDNGRMRSNYGARHVELAAPGDEVVSLRAQGGHAYYEGTSFAAPQVAGALALGRSLAPGATAAELVAELVRTARRSPELEGLVTSGGVLDVAAFLRSLERPSCSSELPPTTYLDVDRSSPHAFNIDCLTWYGVTRGVGDDRFAPKRGMTRGETASFLARILALAGDGVDSQAAAATGMPTFADTEGSVHAQSIEVVAAAGIARGRDDGTFGPAELVTRAQMAAFVVRSVEVLTDQVFVAGRDWFDDVNGSAHEASVLVARDLGITQGSVEPRRFEPDRTITRDQMASFTARLLDVLGRQGVTVDVGS